MKSNRLWIALGVTLAILMAACAALSAATLLRQEKMQTFMLQQFGGYEDVNQENDVVIGGEYTILSTRKISDAYLSGNTESLSDADKETLDMASAILSEIITDDMSDYEKEKAVYEWLVSRMKSSSAVLTVIPDNSEDCYTPHGVLKYRNAVCVGYATTFRLFMHMMNIECMVVHNNTLGHSWDLVQLDGDWYHVDCYSDADSTMYVNFNMNDTQCAVGHEWNRGFFPAASGSSYNYAMMNCVELEDIYAVPQWLAQACADGQSVVSATFRQEITEDLVPAARYMADTMSDRMGDYMGGYYVDHVWLQNADGAYVLTFYLPQDNGGTEPEALDPETMNRVDEAINAVLGEISYYDYDY